jgi:hypothetical protein
MGHKITTMSFVRAMMCTLWLMASISPIVGAAEPTWQEQQNLPEWAMTVLTEKSFAAAYTLSTRINPYFLHGDFNGDGKLDVAVLATRKGTGQEGIAIVHAGAAVPIVVGAGTALGHGSADFRSLDAWSLYVKQGVGQGASGSKPPTLRGDALLVQKLEAASALIYWDGKAYRWYQQGD